jgi:hypothetical protein
MNYLVLKKLRLGWTSGLKLVVKSVNGKLLHKERG